MVKERLKAQHIDVLAEYGLESIDRAEIFLFRYKSGEFILRQGYPCPYVLLVLEGKMKIFNAAPNGRTLLFCYNAASGIIGEVEFAADCDAAASSVQAITDAACIGIPRERYRNELKGNIAFMNAVSAALAQKLFRSSKNNAAMMLHPLAARLCAYISMTNEDGCFKEKLTDVAQMLGTSYRHLLRTIHDLCVKGVLEKTPQGYFISDAAALLHISDDCYME